MQQYVDALEYEFNDGAWMQDQNDNEHFLMSSIQALESVNKKLSKLLLQKEDLTENIISALAHKKEGQSTYDFHTWKIEVKTPCIYSLNKKLYEEVEKQIPKKFNPVKKSISYTIDKKKFDEYLCHAPDDISDLLIDLVDKKPAKASVNIKERV